MDAFQQMSLHEGELTPTEHRVFDFVMGTPEAILQNTTTMAAKQVGVSQSAVSRFCQKVGYDSFGEFRMALMLSLSSNTPTDEPSEERQPVDYLCDMIQATNDAVRPRVIDDLCERILAAHAVYTTGGGLSSPPALMLSMELLKYNVPSYFMQSGQEMIHLHVSDPDDLVIIFSSKNDTQRMMLNVLGEMPAKRRPHCVMVSHSATHPLRRLVDDFVLLPTWQTERYPVYIEPMTSMLAFCSILMTTVSQKTGSHPDTLPPIVNGRRRSE